MQEGSALLPAYLAGLGVSVVVAVAAEHDLCAVALGGLNLGDGRGGGHYDGGGYAEVFRCQSDALGVISRRGGDDTFDLAALCDSGDLVAGAPYLEGAGLLAIFALEINLSSGHFREG